MDAKHMIDTFPQGLLNWYQFDVKGKALYIAEHDDCILELLEENCREVKRISLEDSLKKEFLQAYNSYFSYIVIIGLAELLTEPVKGFAAWRGLLKCDGHMLIGMNNRLGLRYFCGDRDLYTNRNFDGIENYRRILPKERMLMGGRAYSREEICNMLYQSGIYDKKLYSVLPSLELPQLIYSEDYLPEEELSVRLSPMYHYSDSVFLEEEYLYTDLIKNGMFHAMANAYLIECSLDQKFDHARHVTVSMDRGKKHSLVTIIRDDNMVEKRSLFPEGRKKWRKMHENIQDLKAHGINVLEGMVQNSSYLMPYVKGESAVTYLRKVARSDIERFKCEMDKFYSLILQSSDHVLSQPGMGVMLKRGYVDLVPLNCFYQDEEFLFYDQEFYEENYPANVIVFRMIEIVYLGDYGLESILSKQYFIKRYGLQERLELWRQRSIEFVERLRNQRMLRCFYEQYQANPLVIHTNRQRMNYSAGEFQRIFVNIFQNADSKKIILFGSGDFARRFLVQFQKNYSIYAIVDNNADKWGNEINGISIYSPDFLKGVPAADRRIIICIKNYAGVVRQLQGMGINDYCIYDTNIEYPRKIKAQIPLKNNEAKPKKYHVGYVAGVFDLYHIGHLNMFKRAKEQCDYLIVGVVTDEGVEKYKKVKPFIPFKERIELVRSCQYVDEAVEIPLDYNTTRDAFKMYQFDCQFSGSDYKDNPDWLVEKEFLKRQGAELVFMPYTEGTSSTKIKDLIERCLL